MCPWNKFARAAAHPDFKVRHALDAPRLTELFAWTRAGFEERMRGSAIYRIGYERWSRNIAVALGNAPSSAAVVAALRARRNDRFRSSCASTSRGRSARHARDGLAHLQVVDEPRLAEARGREHHQLPRISSGAPGARVAHREIVALQAGRSSAATAGALDRREIPVAAREAPHGACSAACRRGAILRSAAVRYWLRELIASPSASRTVGAATISTGIAQVGHHAADDGELLKVLLAEHRDVGLDDVEELGDDGRDALEMSGPELPAQDARQLRHLDACRALRPVRIDLAAHPA